MIAPEESFRRAMAAAGIVTSVPIIAGRDIHRFDVGDDRPGSRNGWYVYFDGELPAGAFGCWRRGIKENWCSKSWQGLSPKEQDRIKKRHRETKILWKQEQVKIHAEAREEANRIWNESKAVQGHEYLRNKGVKPFGVRDHNGTLIVPLKDAQDTLNSLQSISPNGTKRFLPGGKFKGCYHLIGTPDEILYITEGYSTGATVHDATGEAVVVAFNAGNLQNVAEILRRKYGDISIVIAADNDAFTDGNPGLTKAKEAATAVGGKIAVPVFNDVSSKPTDFNDLCQLEGAEKVEKLL